LSRRSKISKFCNWVVPIKVYRKPKMTTLSGPNLTGRVIAVTGGASGIGLECVKLLSSLGAKVSVGDLSEEALASVTKEIKSTGGEIFTKAIDVRKRNTVDAWIKETVETFGKLDGAANMAGVIGKNHGKMMVSMSFHLRYMAETDLHSRLQKRLEMNVILSWMSISKVRHLIPRESLDLRTHDVVGVMHSMSAELKALSEGGSIVNAASICGLIGLKGAGAYCASKHGVIGLTRAAAKAVGAKNIRINCVAP
jgi:NAD(P)-dependent dehydrogenase (short-subunit alcohol dehydrogenase family)